MRPSVITILLLFPTATLAVPAENVLIGKVVKVTDGDTITILTKDNEQERIRLWGIDAPEQRGNQSYWKVLRDQLAKLVAGKTVTVTWDKRDRNGRILGWEMVDQGTWVNKVMVLTGFAWWFEWYAPGETQLREAQEAAQSAMRGMWAEPTAVAPWDWRKGVRKLESYVDRLPELASCLAFFAAAWLGGIAIVDITEASCPTSVKDKRI